MLAMRTVVYQSYRTFDVPDIIAKCLATVREWASDSGYEYRFFDDVLFDKVPEWFKEKARYDKLPMSDLGRLIIARELLEAGFDRVVWVDADVFVLSPKQFILPEETTFVCKEAWVDRGPAGQPMAVRKVNNAVMGFGIGDPTLEFLIQSVLRHAEATRTIAKIEFGPELLTHLDKYAHFPRIQNVALVSPLVMMDIFKGGGPWWNIYAQEMGRQFAAINLCGSYLREPLQGIQITEADFGKLIALFQSGQLPQASATGLYRRNRTPVS